MIAVRIGAMLLALLLVEPLAVASVAGGGDLATPGRDSQRGSADPTLAAALRAHRERELGAALAALPPGDGAARLELAESLADLLPRDGAGAAAAAPVRRLVAELCLEAMRLDERQWEPSIGLLMAIEPRPEQRSEWSRWRGGGAERSAASGAAPDGDRAMRSADRRWGDPLSIGRAIDRLLAGEALPAGGAETVALGEWLAAHPRAWPGRQAGLGEARNGFDPPDSAAAIRLLETEWAWLDPVGAGFAGSLLIGGDRPLPEVDLETLERRVREVYGDPSAANGPQ